MPLLVDSVFSSLCQAQNFIMHTGRKVKFSGKIRKMVIFWNVQKHQNLQKIFAFWCPTAKIRPNLESGENFREDRSLFGFSADTKISVKNVWNQKWPISRKNSQMDSLGIKSQYSEVFDSADLFTERCRRKKLPYFAAKFDFSPTVHFST